MTSYEWPPSGGAGSITSIGLADGSDTPIYTISGSPVTTAGTLTFTLSTELANLVFAGPTTGSAAQPGFRSLVAADLPSGAVLSMGAFGSSPNTAGGTIAAQVLTLQPADGTRPGGVSITTQTFAGQKTFSTGLTGTLTGSASLNVLTSALGTLSDAGTDGIVVTGGIGATVGSVSLAQHVADASHNGYLSSADWSTFNGKQGSGNYITALTGDVTASGPGSVAATVAAIAGTTVSGTTGTVNVVFSTSPTLVTPALGTPSAGVLTSCTGLPLTTGVTGTLPIANGGTAVTSVTTAPAATSFAGWDANKNLTANSLIESYTTTATAAGTTTLVVGSTFQQYFTGSTTQSVVLPVTSTLVLGQSFLIVNLSSGVVTVQSSGSNTIQAMVANTQILVTCILTSGTTAASWNVDYSQSSSVSQFSLPTVTDWIAYTPTISAGFGTTSSVSFFYSRQGDFLNVRGTFTSGTSGASLGSISLPGGLAIDTAKTPIGNTTGNPGPQIGLFWSNVTNQLGAVISATGTSTSVVYTGNQITNSGSLTPTNVSTVFNGSQFMSIQFSVPVSGWTSNTTVTLGQAPATSQTANTIYSGPSSGAAANPSFRALVAADFPGAWTSYVPTITSASGSITTSSALGYYQVFGNTTFVQMTVTITTAGTGAGAIIATLPNTAAQNAILSGMETNSTGKMEKGLINLASSATQVQITYYDNLTPIASGTVHLINGVYTNT